MFETSQPRCLLVSEPMFALASLNYLSLMLYSRERYTRGYENDTPVANNSFQTQQTAPQTEAYDVRYGLVKRQP